MQLKAIHTSRENRILLHKVKPSNSILPQEMLENCDSFGA